MAKARVPKYQQSGYVTVETDATDGAVLGRNLRLPDGTVLTADQVLNPGQTPAQKFPITIWGRLLEIPNNIKKLAALAGAGFPTRDAAGDWFQREITVGDRLSVDNGDGETGNPFIDLADSILTASGAISALRVVAAEDGVARYPDQGDSADALLVVGVSISAATDGNPVRVQTDGEVFDAGWAWAPGVVWCGAAGVLTQTIPATGWLLEVGRALSADRILLDIQTPYIRSV